MICQERNIIKIIGICALLAFAPACSKVGVNITDNSQASTGSDTPAGVTKNYYFFVKRSADILFVIDTSNSMAEEQDLLKNGFPSFTSALNAYSSGTLDWHVAITSTDIATSGAGKQGALVAFQNMPANTYYLDTSISTDQANAAFQASVALGVGGSADERGIAAARLTAEREFNSSTSRGFIRPDTSFSVIVLSDEDERSSQDPNSVDYTAPEAIDLPANFVPAIHALDQVSSIPKTISFHSIVTSSQECLDGAGVSMGSMYMNLSNLTNGIIGDICALRQTYQEQLSSLAAKIVNEAKTYTLPCEKIVDNSAEAYEQALGGALVKVPSTFIAPNKIVLQNAPPLGSLIKARFTCLDGT